MSEVKETPLLSHGLQPPVDEVEDKDTRREGKGWGRVLFTDERVKAVIPPSWTTRTPDEKKRGVQG